MGKCPACGYELYEYSELDYEHKLLLSLHHPVQDNRIMAINLLGEIKSVAALPELEAILFEENTNYFTQKSVLQAATKIDGPEGLALIKKAQGHPSTLVQRLANDLWVEIQEKGNV
ncbi:MAG: HEAT repeat domain-containing protein [Chloroflexi bacterium]|nr:HEAT repeat domain-containing protein [Chloroflexota bacterium]